MKSNLKTFWTALPLMLAVLSFVSCGKKAEVKYETSKASKQNISTSVTATGTIEPVTEVEVGTQVSGIIDKIYVDYNSVVKKGQLIAELDKTNLLSELSSAKSNMESAKSKMNYQKSNFNRYKELYSKGLVSADDYENARLAYKQASEDYAIQKESVSKAQTNLGYAIITSPIDGIVLSKEVEEGQTVAAAMETPTLFIIAQDLTDMQVIADVDEADIGGVKEGQRVTFTVDAFPDDLFEGKVTQVRQEATEESNVVTYEVVISAPNDDLKLKPGLTANVTIFTNERNGVLAVPSKALRFAPNENLLAEGENITDCEGKDKVWVRDGKNFKAVPVKIGISNGTYTEILSGIKEGTEVITDFNVGSAQQEETAETAEKNPFMPGPPDKKKKENK